MSQTPPNEPKTTQVIQPSYTAARAVPWTTPITVTTAKSAIVITTVAPDLQQHLSAQEWRTPRMDIPSSKSST